MYVEIVWTTMRAKLMDATGRAQQQTSDGEMSPSFPTHNDASVPGGHEEQVDSSVGRRGGDRANNEVEVDDNNSSGNGEGVNGDGDHDRNGEEDLTRDGGNGESSSSTKGKRQGRIAWSLDHDSTSYY